MLGTRKTPISDAPTGKRKKWSQNAEAEAETEADVDDFMNVS